MSDNKNMELNDEMMAKATGGTGDNRSPQFKVGDKVRLKNEINFAKLGYGMVTDVRDLGNAAEYRIKWEKIETPENPYWMDVLLMKA